MQKPRIKHAAEILLVKHRLNRENRGYVLAFGSANLVSYSERDAAKFRRGAYVCTRYIPGMQLRVSRTRS